MKEGIYAEYGWQSKKKDRTTMYKEKLNKREEASKIHIHSTDEYYLPDKFGKRKGIASLSQEALDSIVRKLLHTMITMDKFFSC